MFYYSVSFSKYTQLGVKYVNALKTGKLGRGLHELVLFSNNSTAPSNLSGTEEGEINIVDSIQSSLDLKATEQKLKDAIASKTSSNSTNNPSMVKLSTKVTTQAISTTSTTAKPISTSSKDSNIAQEMCPEKGSSLVGPLYVDSKVPKMEDVENAMSSDFKGWVDKGGRWKPTKCKARIKMALIIPYRNRYEQLSVFLRHMHPMLKRQNLDYRIIVVEQAGDTIFNRAILFNIGFKEAMKLDQYECFIFHDVDLIPEDDRNEYSCPTSPRHLSVAVDKFNYRLPYSSIFGGAGSFIKEHFELINGFSNKFWGWGGEDDDLYNRIAAKNLKLTRPSMQLGRYKMLKIFHHSGKPDPDRFAKLRDSAQRMGNDGLNTLKYSVVNLTEHRLYTLISVDVTEAMPKKK
ncbi:hypothetical protein ACROYT_G035902 [Oculina patagonica]